MVKRWIVFSSPRRPDPPCPGIREALKYIEDYGSLHPSCSSCWKVMAFNLKPDATEEIISMFKAGLIPFSFALSSDRKTLITRVSSESERDRIIEDLKRVVKDRGTVNWRVSCQALQIRSPNLFKSTKELSKQTNASSGS
ncbi:MAG: hypothetical protein QXI60_07705 [Thermofilaceae archaeon]